MKKRRQPVSLSANIRRLREKLDLTQGELGKRVGEHKSVISHWERGKYSPTAAKLPGLASALNVTVDALLTKAA